MFYLLVFGFLVFLLIEFWPLFLIALVAMIIMFIASAISSSRKKSNKYEISCETSGTVKPKIGAEVSEYFYDEIKRYCFKHHMTISDLIRDAVRAYMDEHR